MHQTLATVRPISKERLTHGFNSGGVARGNPSDTSLQHPIVGNPMRKVGAKSEPPEDACWALRTLIFMLSYAVYGATLTVGLHLQDRRTVDTYDASEADQDVQRFYNDEANTTTWTWTVNANDANLTWVNVTATELSDGAVLRVINSAKLYSHELLGNTYDLQNPLEEEFSCADLCDHDTSHERIAEDGGTIEFHALTSVDPLGGPTDRCLQTSPRQKKKPETPSNTNIHRPSSN